MDAAAWRAFGLDPWPALARGQAGHAFRDGAAVAMPPCRRRPQKSVWLFLPVRPVRAGEDGQPNKPRLTGA